MKYEINEAMGKSQVNEEVNWMLMGLQKIKNEMCGKCGWLEKIRNSSNGDTRFIGQRLQYMFYEITSSDALLPLQNIQHMKVPKS